MQTTGCNTPCVSSYTPRLTSHIVLHVGVNNLKQRARDAQPKGEGTVVNTPPGRDVTEEEYGDYGACKKRT
ncbi:hypothetical protein NDU88_006273 [Pleurodeles waltl]|uniref:Uncharacterized protein n=1 Tax=Pleurodeles waltl TaxID=8319 RepID=A0AAV7N3K4_PLEWA|nr:hypothetical protein NDU88_006273 [Pleurodeles waltl]